MSSAKNIPQWVHPFVSDTGRLAEIVKAIEQQLIALENAKDLVQREIRIDTALSGSLDLLGVMLNHIRPIDTDDEEYRNELKFLVENTTTQTVATVQAITEWISGYNPTVEEYPAYSDVEPGSMRIRMPLNKIQYIDDVRVHVDRIKAAGVSLIVEHYNAFFEAFLESVLVDDYLFFALRTMFYDTLPSWPILGGLGEWNLANWDVNVWDSGTNPSDVLLVSLVKHLLEFIDAVDVDDALFLIGLLYKSDTLDSPTDEMTGQINGFLSESITSLIDDFWSAIVYPFIESFDAGDLDDYLFLIGVLYQSEDLDVPIDDISGQIHGSFETSITSLVDDLYGDIYYPFAELFDAGVDDELFHIGVGYFSEFAGGIGFSDNLIGQIAGFLDEDITSLVDDFLASWKQSYTEDMPNRAYAKIGTAKLDEDPIGFGVVTYSGSSDWDSQEWDSSWWDESGDNIYIIVTEAMT